MIERIWQGWTTAENAAAYERLLEDEVFPSIADKNVTGYHGARLLRRALPSGEIEFVTILSFDSMAAVQAFAGDDHETAYVPPAARAVLSRFDRSARHYELRKRYQP